MRWPLFCQSVTAFDETRRDTETGEIVDADMAEETTRLAKNLLLRDTSTAILTQARVNAANVYKSLL